jgi:hypothetical protein
VLTFAWMIVLMADESDRPAEPYWAERMRAAGYTVRVGTGTDGLPYYPAISYHDRSDESGPGRRLAEFVRRLRAFGSIFRRRIVPR